MTCGIRCVDDALVRSFYRLGLTVGKQPGYFIIIPILLTLLCATGFQRLKYEIDPEYLFSPVRGEGKAERSLVEQNFKVNYTSRFNVARITRAGRFGRVIVTTKKNQDRNMLRTDVFRELRELDDLIQNTTVTYDEEDFTYRDICARWNGECFTNDILNLDHIIDEVERGDLNLTWPVMFNPVTWDAHAFPVYFGGSVVRDDQIVSVPSVQLVYFVNADTRKQDARGSAWEDAFLDAVGRADAFDRFEHLSIARFASRTLDHELERNTRAVVPYFASTFLLMALFSIITCCMSDWVRAKPWLGLLGNVSAAMGTCAAFGAVVYLGVEFIGINLAAPFLMIGIGIDDTFVMLAAWRRTSITASVPERMGRTLSEAAVSITITSVTDMISFWIGILSPFPSVRIFCIYSGFAVLFLFVWHLTFFAGCMAVSGYCEKKNLHSLICIKVLPVSQSGEKSRLYRWFCSGGVIQNDDVDTIPTSNGIATIASGGVVQVTDPPIHPADNREHAAMRWFRDVAAVALCTRTAKAIILVAFVAYLAGAAFGLTRIKEGLERRRVAKADSYSVTFFDREDEFFREFPYRIQVIITGEHNYSDPLIQSQVEDVMQALENTSYITSPLYSESWLRSFTQYMERNQDYLNVSIDTEENFIAALKEYWLFPANPFSLDVKFDETGKTIVASRFLIQAVNINDTNHEKEMVRALRNICKQSPLNVIVFHPYFVFFDQFELVRPTSIQAMVVGAIIMMLISFIFIPNLICGVWVALSIVSIEMGVAGYMALWDVNLDSISMINLIMCIGFSVDFTAHICYAYMSSKKETSEERVKECLYALGLPIVQGSVSTILGVSALILADSYIFHVFFKMIFLVIFFGALHGLFLLPVLLSLFGPHHAKPSKETDLVKMSSVQKAFPHPYCIPHPTLTMNGSAFPPKPIHKNIIQAYKAYGESDKDLGIGTSGEDSSESSSSKSQRRRALEEDAATRRRYEEGWRRAPCMIDLYGRDAERAWYRHQPRRSHSHHNLSQHHKYLPERYP